VTNRRDGCVQTLQLSCLDHKSPHILWKRLPIFLQRVVQRFPKPGMPQILLIFPVIQYLYS